MSNTVLITGCSRGLGLEFVHQYLQAGWKVIATVRTLQSAPVLQALSPHMSQLQIVALDVEDMSAIQSLAKQLQGECIDVLISNAGIYPASRLAETTTADWMTAFRVNTMATYYLATAFLPHLQRSSQPKLLAITSKMGSISDNTSGGEYIYRSSKTALNMVVKSLSIDLRPQGIIVAALHPGWVRTDMGGPQGLLDVDTSVAGLRQVIADLQPQDSGNMMAYDGQVIPW